MLLNNFKLFLSRRVISIFQRISTQFPVAWDRGAVTRSRGLGPHFAEEIWKRSFISTVRPTVHANPLRKRSILKTLFKPEEFWKRRLCVLVWTENILKTEFFENNDVRIL